LCAGATDGGGSGGGTAGVGGVGPGNADAVPGEEREPELQQRSFGMHVGTMMGTATEKNRETQRQACFQFIPLSLLRSLSWYPPFSPRHFHFAFPTPFRYLSHVQRTLGQYGLPHDTELDRKQEPPPAPHPAPCSACLRPSCQPCLGLNASRSPLPSLSCPSPSGSVASHAPVRLVWPGCFSISARPSPRARGCTAASLETGRLDCGDAGPLGCWAAGPLGRWAAGLLGCWVVG
jgi:hypothetical protein